MIKIFSIFLLVMELALMFCCFLVRKKKNEYSEALLKMYYVGIGTVLAYILFLVSPSQASADFFGGLYYIALDWLLLYMMKFMLVYTNTQLPTKFIRYAFLWLVVADTVFLLQNNMSGQMFEMERMEHDGLSYWSAQISLPHYYHLCLCYLMAVFTAGILINRIVRSQKIYRKAYFNTLLMFVLAVSVNVMGHVKKLPVDLALFLYVLLAFYFCYYLLYFAPRGLVESILINVTEEIDNGIVCFDLRGKCIYANANARKLLGIDEKHVDTLVDSFYLKWTRTHPQESVDYESWDKEYPVSGEDHHFHIEFQRLKGYRGATLGFFYRLTDKTVQMQLFQEEQYFATHDRLTGLYNKDYFFQKASEIIRRDPGAERYMVCVNIKNFWLLNELFGEEMGDKILVAQAALLKYTNYEDCIQGRIEGEKFAMLISKENFNSDLSVKNTGRLQYLIDGRNYKLNIAMGVYNITDPDESPRSMYDKACMAVESQDSNYQKTVVYYDTKILQQMMQEKNVAEEFEVALKNRQFKMFLQPQVDSNGKLVGAEALVRWQHPQRGLVFPADFIPVAEKTRLISRLDEYMWEMTAEKLQEWKRKGIDNIGISVNISAKDFYYIDIYQTLTKLVKKYDMDPSFMKLEVSETELLSDAEPQIAELNRLQDCGFCIQIDDFGKGYSSLNMLQKIRANALKIDLRLMDQGMPFEKKRSILNAIITMAKALDMEAITESVETEDEVRVLTELGCNTFQGYYFEKPIPVEEFEQKYLKA